MTAPKHLRTTRDDLTDAAIRALRLTKDERALLRRVVATRLDLTGRPATLTHIFENAAAATSFIEAVKTRLVTAIDKKLYRANMAARRRTCR